jgi:hypothetical protein
MPFFMPISNYNNSNPAFVPIFSAKKISMAGRPKKTIAERKKEHERKKSARLNTIRQILESRKARSLQEIFDIYPPSLLAKDLSMAYATLKRRIANPKLFSGDEKRIWAALIGVEYEILRDFIDAEIERS